MCSGTGCHPYVWTPPVCLDAPPECLDVPLYVGIPPYAWMPPLCFNTTHMFGWLLYIWMHPYVCILQYVWTPPICLNALLYVWMSPYVCTLPVCLDGLMFGCSLHVWTPPVCLHDVWMPPVHTQHKESMLCHTKGVSICAHTF